MLSSKQFMSELMLHVFLPKWINHLKKTVIPRLAVLNSRIFPVPVLSRMWKFQVYKFHDFLTSLRTISVCHCLSRACNIMANNKSSSNPQRPNACLCHKKCIWPRYIDLWCLELENLWTMPAQMANICAEFHQNSSEKWQYRATQNRC